MTLYERIQNDLDAIALRILSVSNPAERALWQEQARLIKESARASNVADLAKEVEVPLWLVK